MSALKTLLLTICKYIMNITPVFHISKDSNYGTINSLEGLRYSLFAIPFGTMKIYFLSFCEWKFNPMKVLRLSDVLPTKSPEKIAEKSEDQYKMCKENNDKTKHCNSFLTYKISEQRNRLSTLYNKLNCYNAIALVYIGFLVYTFDFFILKSTNLLLEPSTYPYLFSLVFGVNFLFFIGASLQVKGYSSSSFMDFKKDVSPENMSKSLYHDWYSGQDEVYVAASIVKNIEKYFKLSLLFLITSWVFQFIDIRNTEKAGSVDQGFYIYDQDGNFNSHEFSRLFKNEATKGLFLFVYNPDGKHSEVDVDFIEKALGLNHAQIKIMLSENNLKGDPLIIYQTKEN